MIIVELPEEILKIIKERGIDVVDLVLSVISRTDPTEGIRLRLELARRYMTEAREYMNKGDSIQASEKHIRPLRRW